MMPATSLVCIYKNPFEKTASVKGYEAQTATQFLQSKTQHFPRRRRGSAVSESACQLLERLIVLELRDVLDRCDGDVQ